MSAANSFFTDRSFCPTSITGMTGPEAVIVGMIVRCGWVSSSIFNTFYPLAVTSSPRSVNQTITSSTFAIMAGSVTPSSVS